MSEPPGCWVEQPEACDDGHGGLYGAAGVGVLVEMRRGLTPPEEATGVRRGAARRAWRGSFGRFNKREAEHARFSPD